MLIIVWISALIAIPLAAVRVVQLWHLVRTGRFVYRSLGGERTPTTRAERPGWYWFAIADSLASLAVYVFLIGFGVWTLLPH